MGIFCESETSNLPPHINTAILEYQEASQMSTVQTPSRPHEVHLNTFTSSRATVDLPKLAWGTVASTGGQPVLHTLFTGPVRPHNLHGRSRNRLTSVPMNEDLEGPKTTNNIGTANMTLKGKPRAALLSDPSMKGQV